MDADISSQILGFFLPVCFFKLAAIVCVDCYG